MQDRCFHARPLARVAVFTHVRSVQASPEIRIKTAEGAEPVGVEGRRAEVKTWPHGPDIRARGASAQSVWRGRGVAQFGGVWRDPWSCAEAWSLEPSVWGEAEESEGDASWERSEPAVPRRAARSCTGRGRAGENSPASAKRSEVIGLQNSSSSAEGRTGSYKEQTAATLAAVGTGRRGSPHRGTTRVEVTCTVSWSSFGPQSSTS